MFIVSIYECDGTGIFESQVGTRVTPEISLIRTSKRTDSGIVNAINLQSNLYEEERYYANITNTIHDRYLLQHILAELIHPKILEADENRKTYKYYLLFISLPTHNNQKKVSKK